MSAECLVDECTRDAIHRGWCTMHYNRWYLTGETRGADPEFGELHHNWSGDAISYGGMHHRVRAWRGSASDRDCLHCGSAAHHWAYDHEDENESLEDGKPYSTDVDHYIPLCRSCHKKFDAKPPVQFCLRGHEYTPENTRTDRSGNRYCITCYRMKRPMKPREPKTHCVNGHPYDEANTGVVSTTGARYCRTCARQHQARYKRERREREEMTAA